MTIKGKITLVMMLLFFVVAVPMTMFIDSLVTDLYTDHIADELREEGEKLTSVVYENQHEHLQHLITELHQVSLHHYLLLDERGDSMFTTLSTLVERDQIQQSFKEQVLKGSRVEFEDRSDHEPLYVVGFPILGHNEVHGALFLSASLQSIDEALGHFHRMMVLVGGGALALALTLIIVIANRMVRPLLQMKEATRLLAGGNFDAQVAVNSHDEVGLLGRSINELGGQLKHHEEMRLEFLANVTHELRTPLSYIHGYSQVLEQELVTDEAEKKRYQQLVVREAQRMQRLVSELADLSELQGPGFQLIMGTVELIDVIESTLEKVQPLAHDKGITLHFAQAGDQLDSIKVRGDRDRLEQVLINLLSNAIRFTPADGQIDVVVNLREQDVEVQVRDTGIGIPKQDLPHLFERFYRVEKSRNREKGGMGLGLPIVKQIVERHGGRVWIDSEEGVGTVVSFTLQRSKK